MRIKFLVAHDHGVRAGDIVEMQTPEAKAYIARGLAEEVPPEDAPKEKVTPKAAEAPRRAPKNRRVKPGTFEIK